jgi:putative hydrolase of HD superfamily
MLTKMPGTRNMPGFPGGSWAFKKKARFDFEKLYHKNDGIRIILMSNIADLLFQSKMLKEIPRSGFHFLGVGKESVAEHCFSTAFIALVMAQIEPDVDATRLMGMCLVHDLAEARIGDLNTVNKVYVNADEDKALSDSLSQLAFGQILADLAREFNENRTREAKLARDADQLALVLDLKALADIGYRPPEKWLPPIIARLQTDTGKQIAEKIMCTEWDGWWLKNTLDRNYTTK